MVVLFILLIIQFSTRSYSLWNLRILSSCQRNMPLKHSFKSYKTNSELLKKCQVNQLSITTTPIRFNVLQVCPYVTPFEFTVLLLIPSFHVVSSNFCFQFQIFYDGALYCKFILQENTLLHFKCSCPYVSVPSNVLIKIYPVKYVQS